MSIKPRDGQRTGSTRRRTESTRQRTPADDRYVKDDAHDDEARYDEAGDESYDDGDESYDDQPTRDDDADRSGRRSDRRGSRRELSATDAAKAALAYLTELTGKAPIGIASLERGDDGWVVGVEVVEDRRIPSSTDILAIYRAQIGPDGSLDGYQRLRRYARGQTDRGGTG